MQRSNRYRVRWAAAALGLAGTICLGMGATSALAAAPVDNSATTTTPIKHVVVIYNENESFDHYFGTYPNATNADGTKFTAAAGTPVPNNYVSNPTLLTANPNAFSPQRLTPTQALTCDQNHSYKAEQGAFNDGAMDLFVEKTNTATCSPSVLFGTPGLVMDYFDGNTVTGLWNYAQNYAMSDNSFGTTFGPSTPGAINLVSGQTHGGVGVNSVTGAPIVTGAGVSSPDSKGVGTVTSDPDPFYDDCADTNHTKTSALVQMQGKNIGDLLNAKGVTWGSFQSGFKPTTTAADSPTGYAVCGSTTNIVAGGLTVAAPNYVPHHSPFEYYESTSNPHHLPPTSVAAIGHSDQANHNYDVSDFNDALAANNLPAVSIIKPPAAQDGHPGSSDPINEQKFLVNQINAIEKSPSWSSTAIIINYDDSDGWYDHVASPILNGSSDAANNSAICTSGPAEAAGLVDRCGPGPRLPMLVISPFAKQNFIDHTATEQTSITKFIEDNWSTGRIGDASFDARAGTLNNMFDFAKPQRRSVILAADGSVSAIVEPAAPAAVPVPPAADPALAATGVQAGTTIAAAALLLSAGLVLVFTRRRRSSVK